MHWNPHVIKRYITINEIYTFFKMDCDRTFNFTGESHNFWELMYILDGSLCVSADEKIYNLHKGQIIFHKPLELHKFYVTGQKGACILVISYRGEGEALDFFRDKVFDTDSHQEEIIKSLVSYAEQNADNNIRIYDKYLPAFDKINIYSQNVGLYIELLLLSLAGSNSILPVTQTPDSAVFAKAVRYMNDRIYENPSVEEICQYVNVSTSGLKRIFSRYAGLGIHKYFLKLKLKTAMELLSKGHSTTYVAEKLNFSSQGYFSKVFKRETGMLPSSFYK